MRRLGYLAIVVVGLALAVAAQEQTPRDQPTFRGGVDVMPLDVTVLDANRRPVRGLTAADFHVTVDGDERPILAFESVDMPDRGRSGARWLQDVSPDVSTNGFVPDRIVVLLLDDWNTSLAASGAVAVRKVGLAVIEQLNPGDLVGIVYPFLGHRGVDFTTDRAKLRAGVERFSVGRPSTMSFIGGACRQNSCVLDAMRGIATATRAWPDRRKLLVYISPEGYYLYRTQNIEERQSERNAAAIDMTPALTDTFRELQRAGVTVYQFDPRGLEETVPGITAESNVPVTRAAVILANIGMFADHTGGTTVTRTNEPWGRVPEMFSENDSYYMLGIAPSTRTARSGFHPIRVTVNRPNVVVNARSGYYNRRPEREAPTPTSLTALDRAMEGPVPLADLPLSLTTAAFRVPGKRNAAVAVTAGLSRATGLSEAETVEVSVRALDESTVNRESRGVWTAKMRLRPQASAFGSVHYDTLTRVDLPTGSYEVRLSMRRASDRVAGGVRMSLVIPDFERERVSVSGVVLGRVPGAALSTGEPMADVLPFAPTTRRAFATAETIAALLRVYQGGKDPLRLIPVTARIMNDRDETVYEVSVDLAPATFTGPTRSAEFQVPLPLEKLSTGEYLLTIEATHDGRPVRATPVRFRVRGG